MHAGMSKKSTLSLFLALGVLSFGAGCAASRNVAEGTGNLAGDAAESVSSKTRDGSITFAVKTAMIDDEMVEADEINVDTSNGVVTLNGTQPSLAAMQRAVDLAWKAEGVRSVVNNLVIAPND